MLSLLFLWLAEISSMISSLSERLDYWIDSLMSYRIDSFILPEEEITDSLIDSRIDYFMIDSPIDSRIFDSPIID